MLLLRWSSTSTTLFSHHHLPLLHPRVSCKLRSKNSSPTLNTTSYRTNKFSPHRTHNFAIYETPTTVDALKSKKFSLFENLQQQQTTITDFLTYNIIRKKHNNDMKLTFLGTSSGVPTFDRSVSNINLSLGDTDGSILMFDCGEGTQNQYRKSSLKSGKISTIFITHLHGDHVFGLPGFLCTLSGNNPPTRTEIQIYGPVGIYDYVHSSLKLSDSHASFVIRIFEMAPPPASSSTVLSSLDNDQHYSNHNVHVVSDCVNYSREPVDGTMVAYGGLIPYDAENQCYHVYSKDGVSVRAAPIYHRVFTVGYVIEEQESVGKLDLEKAKQLGVPRGPMLSKLKSGQDVTLDDGTVVKSSQVLGEPQKGRKIVVLGDTHDPTPIAHIAKDCDIITHEATLSDSQQNMAEERGHSCPSMAASFAKKIGAKNLILTHFSARFSLEGVQKEKVDSVDLLKMEAEQVFTPQDGTVYLANDFRSFILSKDKSIKQEQQEVITEDSENSVAQD